MACERFRKALTEVGAGAPAPAELQAHLGGCEACRAELQAVERALALADASLSELLAEEPPATFRARIRQAVGEEAERAGRRRRWFWAWGAAQAVGGAVMIIAVLVVSRQARIPQPAPAPSAVESQDQAAGPEMSRPAEAKEPSQSREEASPSSLGPGARVPPPRRPAAGVRTVLPEPEVLVPPGQAEVLLRFALELQQRQVAPDSLLVADLTAPLPEPRPIEIPLLEVVPLDPSGTL